MIAFIKDDIRFRVESLMGQRSKLSEETNLKIIEVKLLTDELKIMAKEIQALLDKLKNSI